MSDTKFMQFLGIKVSRASFYILITGMIVAIILAIFLPFPYNIFISIGCLLIVIMQSYTINCTQVGHCKIWAWILTSVFIFYICMYTIILLINRNTMFNTIKVNSKS